MSNMRAAPKGSYSSMTKGEHCTVIGACTSRSDKSLGGDSAYDLCQAITSDDRRLITSCSDDLRRAVGHELLMAGCGHVWRSNIGSEEDFGKSIPVERYDYFVSHDWGAPPWQKVLALCLHFNCIPALGFGAVLNLGGRVAVTSLGLPSYVLRWARPTWFLWTCPLATTAMLFYWQLLRKRCCRPIRVFVDKLCICQGDSERKSAGILSLGAFIKASRKLLILWSPRTFQRLWCTYEYASWVKFNTTEDCICIEPLFQAVIVAVSFCIAWFCVFVEFSFCRSEICFIVTTALVFLVWTPWVNMKKFKALQELNEQLRDFDMENAACFCCTVNHIHPDTQEVLACDRELIKRTLLQWRVGSHQMSWISSEGDRDEHLTYFDEAVQGALSRRVPPESYFGLNYDRLLWISFPVLCWSSNEYYEQGFQFHLVWQAIWLSSWLAVFPLLIWFSWYMPLRCSRLLGIVPSYWVFFLFCILGLILGFTNTWAKRSFCDTGRLAPGCALLFTECFLCLYLYRGCVWHPRCRAGHRETE